MPSYIYVDDGIRGYWVDENVDWSHICMVCNDIFETTRPLPSEEARFCPDCYLDAIEIIQSWWRKRLGLRHGS
jgi:rRNA maturation endonuclease Nob1